jgi:hypothetical protein
MASCIAWLNTYQNREGSSGGIKKKSIGGFPTQIYCKGKEATYYTKHFHEFVSNFVPSWAAITKAIYLQFITQIFIIINDYIYKL